MAMSFSGNTAIAGIGATDFSKCSGRSTLRLAVEACEAAIRDAGIRPEMIDGMVSYTVDDNHEIDLCRSIGTDRLTHFSRIHHSGGAACGTIHQAAMAVASGAATYCLVYRAFNERSWLYYTDWFWYLNWSTHRFVMTSLSFAPSDLGRAMAADGIPQDAILRTPRAIDSMMTKLEKVELSDADRETLDRFRPRRSP